MIILFKHLCELIGAKYCDQRVCLSVYGSGCPLSYLKNRKCRLGEIFRMLPVAVARSSSDDCDM